MMQIVQLLPKSLTEQLKDARAWHFQLLGPVLAEVSLLTIKFGMVLISTVVNFGFMIIDGKQLSDLASPVTMAKSYNKKTGKDFDGKTVFELADTDDPIAQEEREKFLHALAVAIFNIQHSFDPEKNYYWWWNFTKSGISSTT